MEKQVILCDFGDVGLLAKNTYESIREAIHGGFWFVLIPGSQKDYEIAKSWANDKHGIIVANYKDLQGGYVSRNIVYDLFPESEYYTRVVPGAILTESYFSFLHEKMKDRVIGAVGAVGYYIHGNWENIEGNQVLPKHICHVVDDCLWSWRKTAHRYDVPFHTTKGGHYDHQFFLHSMGLNIVSAPSDSVLVLPDMYDIMALDDVAIHLLSEKWKCELDMLKPLDIVNMNS